MARTRTTNGAGAHTTTGNPLVDLFFNIGASRSNIAGAITAFKAAYKADPLKAAAILCYARDIRHDGAGEREVFRAILKEMARGDMKYTAEVLELIPAIGRFDDYKSVYGTQYELTAQSIWVDAIKARNVLAAKWAKREDKVLQRGLSLNEAGLRKMLSALRAPHIVETKMCEKRYDEIDYSKLPSVAGMRYAKAFGRNDAERYAAFIGSKETKVNASVGFPHDVWRMYKGGGQREAANKYWENLPDLGVTGNCLVVADTSSSMTCTASGIITCLDVSISLGTYLSQRIEGKFKNTIITFNNIPQLMQLPTSKDACSILDFVARIPWGGSTNLQATYELVLSKAISMNCTDADMPEYLLILSDMQFNQAMGDLRGKSPETLYENMRKKFAAAGFKMPKVVFWNLNSRPGSFPETAFTGDTALISGFSPNIIKPVLNMQDVVMTPETLMNDAIAPFITMLQA